MNRNRIVLAIVFGIALLSFSYVSQKTTTDDAKKFVVVLDAGHGGHDPGNLGNGFLEKNIALKVVLKVGELLADRADIEVVYTRDDDTFVDLFVRGEIANNANADLFVSVHCNAHSSNAYGAETYVLSLGGNTKNIEVAKKENSVIYLEDNYEEKYSDYDLNSPEFVIGSTILQEEFLDQSITLAKLVQDNFVKTLKRKDRKVKQAAFIVLHQTFMPSVLVELGFLTNKNEGSYLNSAKGEKEMSTAIANAILRYKDGVDADVLTIEEPAVTQTTPKEEPKVQETKPAPKPAPTQVVTTKETPKEVVKEPAPAVKTVKKEVAAIQFKVQLMAGSKKVALTPANFKGLDQISIEPYKNLFRYLYGSANSYEQAKALQATAKAKGYTSCYVVAYKNGARIPVKEALK